MLLILMNGYATLKFNYKIIVNGNHESNVELIIYGKGSLITNGIFLN